MRAITFVLAGIMLAPALAAAAPRDNWEPGVQLHGYLTTTLFWQNKLFAPGDGQIALFLPRTQPIDSDWYGGDVRNTSVIVEAYAPRFGDWYVSGRLHVDFFGAFKASGTPFTDLQPQVRLFTMYVEARYGNTKLRMGQMFGPLFGYPPESLSHKEFPIGFGSAGFIGLYYPGILLIQDIPLDSDLMGVFEVGVFQSGWIDQGLPGVTQTIPGAIITAVNDHIVPQGGARFELKFQPDEGLKWKAFVAGHVDYKDQSDLPGAPSNDDLVGWAGEGQFQIDFFWLTVKGGGYYGHSIAQQFAQLLQFGDVTGWGAWGQAGVTLFDYWSVWGFYGRSQQHGDDVSLTTPRNWTVAAMVRFQAGPVACGFEWYHSATKWVGEDVQSGNQVSFTSILHF